MEEVIKYFKKLDPSYLPSKIFDEVSRVSVAPALEVVCLRLSKGNLEVLLIDRGPNDLFWPNMLHSPGTILRPTDKEDSFKTGFERIFVDELKNIKIIRGPYYCGIYFKQYSRGRALGLVHWILTENSEVGKYYPVKNLPKRLIKEQIGYIKECADMCQIMLNGDKQMPKQMRFIK